MATTAWKYPSVAVSGLSSESDSLQTQAWTNPGYVSTSDSVYSVSSGLTQTAYSRTLRVYDFGFTSSDIPSNATITGVEFEVLAKTNASTLIADRFCYLVTSASSLSASNRIGSDKRNVSFWTTSDATYAHGGASDLWGATLTPAIVTSSDFGVDLAVKSFSTPSTPNASIDYVRMRVSYSVPVADPSLSGIEDDDSLSATGGPVVVGTFSGVEDDDSLSATAAIIDYRAADFSGVEDDDILSATGGPVVVGTFSGVEDDDTVTALAAPLISATFSGVEDDDSLTGNIGGRQGGRLKGLHAAPLLDLSSNVICPPYGSLPFQGTVPSDALRWADVDWAGVAVIARPKAQGPRVGIHGPRLRGGTLTSAQPIAIRSLALGGARLNSFKRDWYNRIHILPNVIDFGSVANDATRQASIWNAWLTGSALTGFTVTNDTGVGVSGIELGDGLKALELTTIDVTALSEGPATIDTLFTFDFDTHGLGRLSTTGIRSVLFEFAPNWKSPVDVNIEYRTDIITSRSGQEQRRSLRSSGRKSIEFSITVERDRMRAFNRLLQTAQNRPVTMADPTRSAKLLAGTPAFADGFQVAEVPSWIAVGSRIMIENGDRLHSTTVVGITSEIVDLPADTYYPYGPPPYENPPAEALSLADIDVWGLAAYPDMTVDPPPYTVYTVTISEATEEAWPQDTVLRPALIGLLDGSISTRNHTNTVLEAGITFNVTPASEVRAVGSANALVHRGREVFPFKPNWGEQVSSTFAWPVEQVDFGFGRIAAYRPVDFGTMTRRATFIGVKTDEAADIQQFFERMHGRRGEFYLPTGLEDLIVREDLVEGAAMMRVVGPETADDFAGNQVYDAICIKLVGGRLVFRSVIDAFVTTDDAGIDSVLELDTGWSEDIPLENIVCVSWMPVFRMASDTMSIEWLTDQVVQTQLTMQSLPDRTPEGNIPIYDGAALFILETEGVDGVDVYDPLDVIINVTYPEIVT